VFTSSLFNERGGVCPSWTKRCSCVSAPLTTTPFLKGARALGVYLLLSLMREGGVCLYLSLNMLVRSSFGVSFVSINRPFWLTLSFLLSQKEGGGLRVSLSVFVCGCFLSVLSKRFL